ncbi:MAG: DUF1475 family protein [Phycisphaerales bacterium]
MKIATLLSTLGALAMTAALVYGFAWGGGWSEVRTLMGAPWFVVSLVDVYVGFALFAGWVLFRERPAVAAPVVLALMILGNAVACVYVVVTLARCGGDWARFWMGVRAEGARA